MESLIIYVLTGFWLVLFGAMAIVPFLLESKPPRHTPITDDVIISVQPVAMPQTPRHAITSITVPAGEPERREAA